MCKWYFFAIFISVGGYVRGRWIPPRSAWWQEDSPPPGIFPASHTHPGFRTDFRSRIIFWFGKVRGVFWGGEGGKICALIKKELVNWQMFWLKPIFLADFSCKWMLKLNFPKAFFLKKTHLKRRNLLNSKKTELKWMENPKWEAFEERGETSDNQSPKKGQIRGPWMGGPHIQKEGFHVSPQGPSVSWGASATNSLPFIERWSSKRLNASIENSPPPSPKQTRPLRHLQCSDRAPGPFDKNAHVSSKPPPPK